jgi:hypothetical protein
MQRDHIKSWVPKQDITDRFNEHAQEWIKHTVWKSDCRSWYKDNDTGRVNGKLLLLLPPDLVLCVLNTSHSAIWPGSSNHYSETIAAPRYEDFDISYLNKNPWAHLGMGFAQSNVDFPNSDVCPYLSLENIDPRWLKAIGYEGPALQVEKAKEEKERPAVEREAKDVGRGEQPKLPKI